MNTLCTLLWARECEPQEASHRGQSAMGLPYGYHYCGIRTVQGSGRGSAYWEDCATNPSNPHDSLDSCTQFL